MTPVFVSPNALNPDMRVTLSETVQPLPILSVLNWQTTRIRPPLFNPLVECSVKTLPDHYAVCVDRCGTSSCPGHRLDDRQDLHRITIRVQYRTLVEQRTTGDTPCPTPLTPTKTSVGVDTEATTFLAGSILPVTVFFQLRYNHNQDRYRHHSAETDNRRR